MSTNQEKIQWSPTCTVFTSRLCRGCFIGDSHCFLMVLIGDFRFFIIFRQCTWSWVQIRKNLLNTNLHRFYQQVISRLLSSTIHIVFWWCLLVISDFLLFFGSVLDHEYISGKNSLITNLHRFYQQVISRLLSSTIHIVFWWCLLVISDFLLFFGSVLDREYKSGKIQWSPTYTVFTSRLYRGCFHRRFTLFFDGTYFSISDFLVVYLTMENIHWSPTCTVFTRRLYRSCFHRRFALFFDGAYWWFPIFCYFSVVYLTMSTCQEKIHWSPTCTVFTSRLYRGCFHRWFTLFFDGTYLLISDFLLFFGSVLDHGKNSLITNLHRFYQQVISRLLSSTIHIVFWWCLLVISDFLLFFGSVLDHEYKSGKNSVITNLHRFYQQVISRCFHRRFTLFFDGAYWWFPIFYYFSVVSLTMSTSQEKIHWSPTCIVFTSLLHGVCFHRRFTFFLIVPIGDFRFFIIFR